MSKIYEFRVAGRDESIRTRGASMSQSVDFVSSKWRVIAYAERDDDWKPVDYTYSGGEWRAANLWVFT